MAQSGISKCEVDHCCAKILPCSRLRTSFPSLALPATTALLRYPLLANVFLEGES